MTKEELLDFKNELLEIKMGELENTLSNTIAFFSTTFAIVGIVVAILLVIAGWWLNRLFSNKLTETEKISKDIGKSKVEILTMHAELEGLLEDNKKLNKKLDETIKSNERLAESNKNVVKVNKFLQEQIRILNLREKFRMVETQINRKLPKITKEMIENSKYKLVDGEIKSDFEYRKGYYNEAVTRFHELLSKDLKLNDYIIEVEDDEYTLYEELETEFQEVCDFNKVINDLLSETVPQDAREDTKN